MPPPRTTQAISVSGGGQRVFQLPDGVDDLLVLVAKDRIPGHLQERPRLAGTVLGCVRKPDPTEDRG